MLVRLNGLVTHGEAVLLPLQMMAYLWSSRETAHREEDKWEKQKNKTRSCCTFVRVHVSVYDVCRAKKSLLFCCRFSLSVCVYWYSHRWLLFPVKAEWSAPPSGKKMNWRAPVVKIASVTMNDEKKRENKIHFPWKICYDWCVLIL